MVFFGALDSTTSSATTLNASTRINADGTFRIGGTVGTTLNSMRWASQSVGGVTDTGTVIVTITLSPAMPDTGYNVYLSTKIVNNFIFSALVNNKTTTSFDMRVRRRGSTGSNTVNVDWIIIDF